MIEFNVFNIADADLDDEDYEYLLSGSGSVKDIFENIRAQDIVIAEDGNPYFYDIDSDMLISEPYMPLILETGFDPINYGDILDDIDLEFSMNDPTEKNYLEKKFGKDLVKKLYIMADSRKLIVYSNGEFLVVRGNYEYPVRQVAKLSSSIAIGGLRKISDKTPLNQDVLGVIESFIDGF